MPRKGQQRPFPGMGKPPATEALFTPEEFPYDLPDEQAYNHQAKKRGLFKLTKQDIDALNANQAALKEIKDQ